MQYSESDIWRLARGAVFSVAGKSTGRLVGFVGDVIAARILGPTSFGLYAIGWTLLRILGLVAPLGLPNGVLLYIPRFLSTHRPAIKGLIWRSVGAAILAGGLTALVLFWASPWLAQGVYHKPPLAGIFRLFSAALPFVALLSVAAAITRSRGEMKYSALLEDFGQPFLGLVLLIGFYLASGLSVTTVILADVFSFAVTAILSLWVVRRLFAAAWAVRGASLVPFAEVLQYSLPTAAAGALTVLVFWVDRLLVGFYLPARDNGLYQAVSQISVLFVMVLAAFNAILGPMYSDFHARHAFPQLEETYRVGTKWGLYISMPIFLVLCFAPREILSVLLGPSYAAASVALVVLSAGQIVNVGTGSVGTLLILTGHQRLWLRLAFGSLLSNIVLCMLLIPRLGIVGAALSTAISLNAMYILAIFRARTVVGAWPYDRRYLKGAIASLACVCLLFAARTFFGGTEALLLGALIVVAGVTFPTVLLSLGLDAEDESVARTALKRVLSRK